MLISIWPSDVREVYLKSLQITTYDDGHSSHGSLGPGELDSVVIVVVSDIKGQITLPHEHDH